MSMSICLFLCLSVRSHNSKKRTAEFTKFVCILAVAVARFLWRRCDLLRTSGFVDDVMFSHNGPVARRVATEHDKHYSRDSKQIVLNNKDLKCSLWAAHWGWSLYDFLVIADFGLAFARSKRVLQKHVAKEGNRRQQISPLYATHDGFLLVAIIEQNLVRISAVRLRNTHVTPYSHYVITWRYPLNYTVVEKTGPLHYCNRILKESWNGQPFTDTSPEISSFVSRLIDVTVCCTSDQTLLQLVFQKF